MKRLLLIGLLAVAFFTVIFSASASEAKIVHMEIGGVPHVAVTGSDGRVQDVFEVSREYHTVAKEKVRKVAKKSESPKNLNTAIKKDVPANNTAGLNTAKDIHYENSVPQARRLLIDWKVEENVYEVSKKGEKKLIKTALRSPGEC